MAFRGEIRVPGDKSISHRAILVNAAAGGEWRVRNLLEGEDVLRSLELVKRVGVSVKRERGDYILTSPGRFALKEPDDIIDAGNSGTTVRIGAGLLASVRGLSVVTGDRYLRKRPMLRVVEPLRRMGALVLGRGGGEFLPLAIEGRSLSGIEYESPVASAQVKSCVLLAGLSSNVPVRVREPVNSRDHTERLMKAMGARVEVSGTSVALKDSSSVKPVDVDVPGDFSSAAFFIGGALVTPDSEIVVRDVLLNPHRTGFLSVVSRMGGDVKVENVREQSGEPVGDIIVRYSPDLRGTVVEESEIPSLIDEVPILSVVAVFAGGVTEIRGAGELRVKESDRIRAMCSNLRLFGVTVEEKPDGMVIQGGGGTVTPERVSSFGDHRVVMSLEILSRALGKEVQVDDTTSVRTSFPTFYDILRSVYS
ncbi:MAG: 3-phosphoshikimate 1-carboxyvinyltransferase [Deltaproteobacteria bacterium]|nr:MAG: 3-phosphoshikimate 1-carboxyvinyltransferase [Deltaproteobacteria bacterium]